jgi:CxxC motif-containing protein (DUF1111 family)
MTSKGLSLASLACARTVKKCGDRVSPEKPADSRGCMALFLGMKHAKDKIKRTAMRQTWRATTAFALVAGLTGSAAIGGVLDEPHLSITPRTPKEVTRVQAVTTFSPDPSQYEPLPGGASTVPARSDDAALSQPSANISFEQELEFRRGNALFEKLWVSSPSSTRASDGLGPLYNARSCQRCHVRDGRGYPPGPDEAPVSLVLKLAVPGGSDDDKTEFSGYLATRPDPTYGGQLQNFGLAGHAAEYDLQLTYQEITVPLSQGEVAQLRAPTYNIDMLGYGALYPDTQFSARVAPQMIGLGLLEAIPAADILAHADPDDTDGDGISGRANLVWSREFEMPMLGRFGHKAGAPTIRQQSAAALANDIGLSSPLYPSPWGDCTAAQQKCQSAPHGDGDARVFEVDDIALDLFVFYSRNLAVPERRNLSDPAVQRGRSVFRDLGCSSCHTPAFVTHRLTDRPEQGFQLIWPYSDMLLHDMGDGLADGMSEARATGREWRTAPLWGIGLAQQVDARVGFLHDGRARSLLEAVLWHDGEARPMRDAVIDLPQNDRAALIKFLESL